MKKYPKMTFAALSAIALNFSCLATIHPSTRHIHREIGTHNNIYDRHLTPLSPGEQISLLKNAITESNVSLAKNILTGHIGKIGPGRYDHSRRERRFFVPMPDLQFEELQISSLAFFRYAKESDIIRENDRDNVLKTTQKIFELITSKFFEVTKNKKAAYQTTTRKIYNNLDSFDSDRFDTLVDLFPSDDSKREFVKKLLNYAKRDNNIDAYEKLFSALGKLSEIKMFKNQPWLQSFISEYIEQTRSDFSNMPIDFIKTVAPDLYNENFFPFLRKCIIDNANNLIDILLPRDENNLPSDVRRLHPTYLNLALEKYHSGEILSSIASYTDTSSSLTNVVQTLTSFTHKELQAALESIKDANSFLYFSLLEERLRCLGL